MAINGVVSALNDPRYVAELERKIEKMERDIQAMQQALSSLQRGRTI